MKRIFKILLTVCISMFVLSACGGTSSDAKSAVVTNAAAPAAGAYFAEAIEADYAPAETVTSVNTGGSTSGIYSNQGVDPTIDTSRKLIRTVHMDVETYEFEGLLTQIKEQISSLHGYIEQSDISGNSIQNQNSRRRAYMIVRIPSTVLDQFVTSMEDHGNVTNKSETTTDVTLQYSDLESRKKSLSIEQDRIWALLEKADTLEAVIALEERLSEIRYELESMESKLRLYDNQVEYSTVHINVSEVKVYTPTEPETIGTRIQKGFARNVEQIKETTVDLIVWIATSVPFLLPILLLIGIVVLVIKKFIGKKIIK